MAGPSRTSGTSGVGGRTASRGRRILLALAAAGGAACWPAAAPAQTASGNGDVNGDGRIDLTDAVYLLSFLFQGGAPPAPFECPPPPPGGKAKVRFLDTLTCQGADTVATLTFCDTVTIMNTDSTNPTACDVDLPPPANGICPSKIHLDTPCGVIDLCADIPVAGDVVYDVVLAADNNGVFAIWSALSLNADGSCPDFPAPGAEFVGSYITCPAGGGGDAGGEAVASWRNPPGGR